MHMTQEKKQYSAGRTYYAEIIIGALTGSISAQHLYDPPEHSSHGFTSCLWPLERALEDLTEGGYVIDLRPLADHPQLRSWVYQAPMSNGRLEGNEIDRFSDEERQAAQQMLSGLEGDFQKLAYLAAQRIGEPLDGGAGPFDAVSASCRAAYWGSRGARIGKRVGNILYWSDGKQQAIGSPGDSTALQKHR
jgi:hypothetical protein